MISRQLNLPFRKNSVFLFGPRQVGKSTLVRHLISLEDHYEIDMLKSDILLKYKSNPSQLRYECEFSLKHKKKLLVFIDEIQRCPDLLNEAHYLIEKYGAKIKFIMTGSSARKLKRSSVNMLAGRAWQFFLFPFTHIELGEKFNLKEVLVRGTLPPVVGASTKDAFRTLVTYVQTYLKEEILDEALVRNIGAFSRFLELAGDQSGKIVNYSTFARDTGVSSKTIKGYYQILEDTLVALKLEPYLKSARKRLIMHPKYYLFDLGVINAICGRNSVSSVRGPSIYGMLFEHFIILETFRLTRYAEKPYRMYHWRSSHGAEVDLVIETPDSLWAVEIKASSKISRADLTGLRSFVADYKKSKPLCVSTTDTPYLAGDIPVIPWRFLFDKDFLGLL